MNEWSELKLGDVINLKRGYDLPSRLRRDGDVPIYSSSGIFGFHNEEKAQPPGVITGRYGTIGQVFLAKTPYWPLNTTLYVQDFKGNDEVFIYYFLKQINWEQFNDKSAVPGVNRNDAHEEEVILPPIPEQRAIASVLSALDDKIDLLNRQNKTLEALAQTLFRQWFVEEAEDGWEEHLLENFVEVLRGLSYKGAGLAEEGDGVPMHNLNSINRGGGYKNEGIKYYKGAFKENHLVHPYEVVVANTDLTQDLALIGQPAVIPRSFGTKSIFSHHLYHLKISDFRITNQFLYYLLMSSGVREQIVGATNGTTVTMLPKNGIEWAVFNLPPQRLIERFSKIAQQFWDKKEANYLQIRTLEKLRDTLLPKLMSGEVRVAV